MSSVSGICEGMGVERSVSSDGGGLGLWVACQQSSRIVIIAGFDLDALNPNFLVSF